MLIYGIFFLILCAIGGFNLAQGFDAYTLSFLIPYGVLLFLCIINKYGISPKFRDWDECCGFTWSRVLGLFFLEAGILVMSGSVAGYVIGGQSGMWVSWLLLVFLVMAVVFGSIDSTHRSVFRTVKEKERAYKALPTIKYVALSQIVQNVLRVYLYLLYAVVASTSIGIVLTERPLIFLIYFSYLIFAFLFFLEIIPVKKTKE